MRILQRPRPKIIHSEPHGDALAVSLLASVSSLDHFGGAMTLGYQEKKNEIPKGKRKRWKKKSGDKNKYFRDKKKRLQKNEKTPTSTLYK